MSARHPIIAVTGSSGSGTSTVQGTFEFIFRREMVNGFSIEGDGFHRYGRAEMNARVAECESRHLPPPTHFGPEGNLFPELEALFRDYHTNGGGRYRHYIHDAIRAAKFGLPEGCFTPWHTVPEGTDCLLYEGLHGGLQIGDIDVARYVDLLIGVVPTINLEWIQKLHRDTQLRGYSKEAVQDTILRRMHDYVHYIVPQFARTDINFQRVPVVDTSNPFVARDVPTLDESLVVIRFRDPRGIDFPYLLNMLNGSWMSRVNTIVVPGGKLDLAMQVILTPLIWKLMEKRQASR